MRHVFWILLFPALASAQTAQPDSSRSLLERLQQRDQELYPAELWEFDQAIADSMLAEHDALGLEAYQDAANENRPAMDIDFGPWSRLTTFNRVEGLVAGASLRLDFFDRVELGFEPGYATGSREFRHHEWLGLRRGRLQLRGEFEDRVVPYGSNRPTWNSLRALIGAADRQDYLHREGGRAMFTFDGRRLDLGFGYESARHRSVTTHEDFSAFGHLARFNPPIEEGHDDALVSRVAWSADEARNFDVAVEHRVAGGDLGGDFAYNRTDVRLRTRRYLLGRHEFVLEASGTRTGGNAPVQWLADVGGLSTVRGYPRRFEVGRSAATGRLEYLVPYDVFRRTSVPLLRALGLQFVPWADAGRVWDGNRHAWVTSVGVGVQAFLGVFGPVSFLRLDLAQPLGPHGDNDLHLELYFAAGHF